jgi:6-phosphogluconolactonase (cycloisomerase 2 family)
VLTFSVLDRTAEGRSLLASAVFCDRLAVFSLQAGYCLRYDKINFTDYKSTNGGTGPRHI